MLSPGSLVLVTIDAVHPYLYDQIETGPEGVWPDSDAWSFSDDEPCFIVATIVDAQSVFSYVMSQNHFGWLAVEQDDGVIRSIEPISG